MSFMQIAAQTNSRPDPTTVSKLGHFAFSPCLFCFQKWSRGRSSLPFQSKIGCRRHLVVSRQERGHKMMLNCFSKESNKIGLGMMMHNGIKTAAFCIWWCEKAWKVPTRMQNVAAPRFAEGSRILYEGVMDGQAGGGCCQICDGPSTWVLLIRWIPSRSPDQTFP